MAIPSPCIDVCKIDGTSGFCIGCLRTRAEIREWKTMDDIRRQRIIDEREQRATMLPVAETDAPPANPQPQRTS